MREKSKLATPGDVARYRAKLRDIKIAVTMRGEDGVRYTFCPPDGDTKGLGWERAHASNGRFRFKRGAMFPVELFVLWRERQRRGYRRDIPIFHDHWVRPVPDKTRIEFRRLGNVWWLVHWEWMPLCFDSFREAVSFANRFVVRKSPRAA